MRKFVPYEKLSKKKKRELDRMGRTTWGEMSPVTRKAEKSTVYNRNRHRRWMEDSEGGVFFCIRLACGHADS